VEISQVSVWVTLYSLVVLILRVVVSVNFASARSGIPTLISILDSKEIPAVTDHVHVDEVEVDFLKSKEPSELSELQ
jgi:hypothetical protein